MKFDIDKKANLIPNEIPNRQNENWCTNITHKPNYKHNNKIFKVLLRSFPSSFKEHSNKKKIKNFYDAVKARKQHFLKIP